MFDLATAKARLGITDTSKDTVVAGALSASLGIAERFCDRRLAFATETANFYNFLGDTLFLPRYPIEAVISSTGLPDFQVHHRLGILELDSIISAPTVTVSYSGGYRVYPADLELALWGIFDQVYPAVTGTTPDDVESVSIPDVGTIKYRASTSALAGVNANVLGTFASILETYRRLTC